MIYQKLLTYLLEGGGLALAARGSWFAWMQWVAYRDSRAARAAIDGRREIAEALSELRYNTPANYCHIIRIHNGGGDLKAGLPMYMSCIYEVCDGDYPQLKGTIRGIEIDDHYREIVAELLRVRDGHAETKSLNDRLLKDIFHMMRAKYVRSSLIKVNRDGIYFLRATSSADPLDGSNNNLHFRKAISVLRKQY